MKFKIKKKFRTIDFYDYIKTQGRDNCKEFERDMIDFTNGESIFIEWSRHEECNNSNYKLGNLLQDPNRNNFRKYMIQGGFIEKDEPEVFYKVGDKIKTVFTPSNTKDTYMISHIGSFNIILINIENGNAFLFTSIHVNNTSNIEKHIIEKYLGSDYKIIE
jgi:hypothetical protein